MLSLPWDGTLGRLQILTNLSQLDLLRYQVVSWSSIIINLLLYTITLYYLVSRHRWGSVQLAICLLWIYALILPLITITIYVVLLDGELAKILGEDAASRMAYKCMFSFGWSMYFVISQRIRDTYVITRK